MFKIWRSHRVVSVNFHNFEQKIVKMLKRNFPKVGTVSEAGFSTNTKKTWTANQLPWKTRVDSFLNVCVRLDWHRKKRPSFSSVRFSFLTEYPFSPHASFQQGRNFIIFLSSSKFCQGFDYLRGRRLRFSFPLFI